MADYDDITSFFGEFDAGPHWMDLEDLTERFHQESQQADDPGTWLRVGSYQEHPLYLSHERARTHVLLVGTDATESTSSGLASFWRHFHNSRQSLVFFDPTAELKRLLAPRLRETHEIWEIAPETPERSLKYNPLAYVASVTPLKNLDVQTLQDRRFKAAYSLAAIYIGCLRPALPENFLRDPDSDGKLLLTMCALHLSSFDPVPPFHSLFTLLLEKERLLPLLSTSPDSQARDLAQRSQRNSYRVRSMNEVVLALADSASRFMQFRAGDDIWRLTEHNEIDFTRLLLQPVALFYTLPPFDMQDWYLITALLYNQLTSALFTVWSDLPADSHMQDLRITIDQPEVLGQLPELVQHAYYGWYDTGLVMGIREQSVLGKVYGERSRNLLEAFRTHMLLPRNSQADREFYARRYGYYHPEVTPVNPARSRPLFTPTDLSQLKEGTALLCPNDTPPALITYPEKE